MSGILLEVRDLNVTYGRATVLDSISFEVREGETLGLVGESGSGKSTLARAVLRLIPATRGSVRWRGTELMTCDAAALRRLRREMQIVFQDPLASLNPRLTVGETLAEPLKIFEPSLSGHARRARVDAMLARVGMTPAMAHGYPHEFSGGQCQRIGVARAMMLNPKLLVCDEPVSSLDVSIQGQIVNLLADLQRECGTAMVFISHNLAVVRHVSHRVLVMYAGTLVEVAARDELFGAPVHPYTRALLASVPDPTRTQPKEPIAGEQAPAGARARAGCVFRARCRHAQAACGETEPKLEEVRAGHAVACLRSRELVALWRANLEARA